MKALDLAGHIINYSKKPVTNIRLQCLLYFIQKEAIVKFGKQAFDDDVVCTSIPYYPEVYYKYVYYGSFPIISEEISEISSKLESLIDEVLKRYENTATWKLVDLAREEAGINA